MERKDGSLESIGEATRARWGWTWLELIGQDVRHAVRLLRRRPAFSLAAIATLTLGIGGATAVFSLLDALLVRMLPVERPQDLVRLVEPRRDDPSVARAFTLATHDALQRESHTLSGVIASAELFRPTEIEAAGERRHVYLQLVSDNYFDILGVGAAMGRVFHQPEPGGTREPVAVISEAYWRRQFGGDASAIGSRFRFRAREFTIAGVASPGFRGTEVDVPVDVWVSLEQVVPVGAEERVRGRWMRVMGRLQPGVTLEQAEAESRTILTGRSVGLEPGGNGYSTLRLRLLQPLRLVALVVALVLLIACANLANLMLAATASRERELAVRRAVGASRSRIVRQLLTESILLAAAGGVLAIVVASWISSAVLGFLPPEQNVALPNLRLALDSRVLAFAALLSCGACLLFGLTPAIRAAGRHNTVDLKAGGGSGQPNRSWLGRGLIVSQVAMCTALLIVAAVFLRTLDNLRGQDAGYREDQLLVADVEPPREYPDPRRDLLIEELRARIAGLPGVAIAALSHVGQLSGGAIEFRIGFPGRAMPEGEQASVIEQRISADFLRAMGTPLIAGREFLPSDDDRSGPVAIVNESFVRRFLPGQDPLGARFFRETGDVPGRLMQVVGVVKDSKWINLRDDAPAMYYRPYNQMGGTPAVRLAMRTAADPALLARELVRIAQSIDRRMVLSNVAPFSDIVNRTVVVERLVAEVSTAFGLLAVLIAAVGLYGVLAYSVQRRRREIGVRMAVGARPGAVEWMFLRESLVLLAIGVAIGLPAALGATRVVASMLFGLGPQDPMSIGAAILVLSIAALSASYFPARRAAGIDPIRALREE